MAANLALFVQQSSMNLKTRHCLIPSLTADAPSSARLGDRGRSGRMPAVPRDWADVAAPQVRVLPGGLLRQVACRCPTERWVLRGRVVRRARRRRHRLPWESAVQAWRGRFSGIALYCTGECSLGHWDRWAPEFLLPRKINNVWCVLATVKLLIDLLQLIG